MRGAVLLVCAPSASAAEIDPPPPVPIAAASFVFAIGDGMLAGGPEEVSQRLGGFGIVVVDGELATADEVAALRAGGAVVLGYLSVGTIEKWRSWYPRGKRFRLAPWADWKDEWFADGSRAKLRRAIARRVAPRILAKGFDGLFLDNVDMMETRNHAAQRPGMRRLVTALADLVHGQGRSLFTQNGHWGLRRLDLIDSIDGWNRRGRHLDLRLRPPSLRPPEPGRDQCGGGGGPRRPQCPNPLAPEPSAAPHETACGRWKPYYVEGLGRKALRGRERLGLRASWRPGFGGLEPSSRCRRSCCSTAGRPPPRSASRTPTSAIRALNRIGPRPPGYEAARVIRSAGSDTGLRGRSPPQVPRH